MPYPGEKPHAFVLVEPGTKWPEFCRHCGDLQTHPVHNVKPPTNNTPEEK